MRFFFLLMVVLLCLFCLLWSMFSAVFREKKNTSEIRREDAQRKKKQWNLGRDPFFPIFPHFKFPVLGCCRYLPWRLPITLFSHVLPFSPIFPHFSPFWGAPGGRSGCGLLCKVSKSSSKAAKTATQQRKQQFRFGTFWQKQSPGHYSTEREERMKIVWEKEKKNEIFGSPGRGQVQ